MGLSVLIQAQCGTARRRDVGILKLLDSNDCLNDALFRHSSDDNMRNDFLAFAIRWSDALGASGWEKVVPTGKELNCE